MDATKKRRLMRIGAISAVAALVVGGGIWAWAAFGTGASPEADQTPTPEVTNEPTPEPEPEALPLPTSVAAQGTIAEWTAAGQTQIADVLPQYGEAYDGDTSVLIDAPHVEGPTRALSSTIAVQPATDYQVSFAARQHEALPAATNAALVIGDTRIPLPELGAEWTVVEGEFANGATDTVDVFIEVSGAVNGLGIDALSITPVDGEGDAVTNGSFEEVSLNGAVSNNSLILRAGSPALIVNTVAGEVTWELIGTGDVLVAEGSTKVDGGASLVPLGDVGEGFYRANLTLPDRTVSTPIAVVDYTGTVIAADARIGVGAHVEHDYYEPTADLARSLGIADIRNDVLWRHNETTRGQYDFLPNYEARFDEIASHGMGLLAIINYGNKLYDAPYSPDTKQAREAYGNYAEAVIDRFDPIAIEVFNEFNHERLNKSSCGRTAECYLPIAEHAYNVLHAAHPDMPIILGATARYEDDWFAELWQLGGMKYADAVSYHPYEVMYEPDRLPEIIEKSVATMQEHAGDTRPIWITELGTSSKPGLMSQSGQATNLLKAAISSLGAGAETFFWYDLINDDEDETVFEGNFGLFDRPIKDVAANPPKPAAFAMAMLTNQLRGHELVQKDDVPEGVASYQFGEGTDAVHVAWSKAEPTTIELPATGPVTVITSAGVSSTLEPVDGVVEVPLDANPSFIRMDDADS